MPKWTVIPTDDQAAILKKAAELDGGRSIVSLLLGPALEAAREIIRRHSDGTVTAPRRQNDGTAEYRHSDGTVTAPRRQNDGTDGGKGETTVEPTTVEPTKKEEPKKIRSRKTGKEYDLEETIWCREQIDAYKPYVGNERASMNALRKIPATDRELFAVARANVPDEKREYVPLYRLAEADNWRRFLPRATLPAPVAAPVPVVDAAHYDWRLPGTLLS